MSIYIRINLLGPESLLVNDMGIVFDKNITDNLFSDQNELNLVSTSNDLLSYLTDNAYGPDSSTLLMSESNNGAPFKTEAVQRILERILVNKNITRTSLEETFNYAYSNHYIEMLYFEDNIVGVNVWEDSSKSLKLFTRTMEYSGDNLIKVTTIDEINSSTMVKDFFYDSEDNIININKLIT